VITGNSGGGRRPLGAKYRNRTRL